MLAQRQLDLTVCMEEVHKPHNLAAIVRTADAIGIHRVHAVWPKSWIHKRKGTARGSQNWVDVKLHPDIGSAVAELKAAGMQILATHLSESSVDFRAIDYTKPTAILVGQEKHGIGEEALALADHHIVIPMVGMVQSLNVSVAAAAIGWQLGVSTAHIAAALEKFHGVGRRFNLKGELDFGRGKALLVDDYGHHPKELEAVFAAARGGWPERRLVVAFQPHRYTRTRDLFDDFAAVLSSADAVVLTEVYPAGEAHIAGADAKSLARAIRARGRIDPVLAGSARDLPTVLADVLADGDLLLLMGAGDIGHMSLHIAAHGFAAKDPA